jgi:hypothetical protein
VNRPRGVLTLPHTFHLDFDWSVIRRLVADFKVVTVNAGALFRADGICTTWASHLGPHPVTCALRIIQSLQCVLVVHMPICRDGKSRCGWCCCCMHTTTHVEHVLQLHLAQTRTKYT